MSNGNSAEASTSPSPAPSSIGNNAPKFGTLVPNRVFVGGISGNTTEQDLLELFSKYGKVKATKVISDRAGVSKGYGFVTFETEEEARKLTQEADNIMLKDRKLNIAPAIKKQVNDLGYIKPYSPRLVDGNSAASVLGTNGTVFFGNGTSYAYTNPMPILANPSDYHQAVAGVHTPGGGHPTFPQIPQTGAHTAVSAATQVGGTPTQAAYPAQFVYPQAMYFPQQYQQYQTAALQPQWPTSPQWRWVSPGAYAQPECSSLNGETLSDESYHKGAHSTHLSSVVPSSPYSFPYSLPLDTYSHFIFPSPPPSSSNIHSTYISNSSPTSVTGPISYAASTSVTTNTTTTTTATIGSRSTLMKDFNANEIFGDDLQVKTFLPSASGNQMDGNNQKYFGGSQTTSNGEDDSNRHLPTTLPTAISAQGIASKLTSGETSVVSGQHVLESSVGSENSRTIPSQYVNSSALNGSPEIQKRKHSVTSQVPSHKSVSHINGESSRSETPSLGSSNDGWQTPQPISHIPTCGVHPPHHTTNCEATGAWPVHPTLMNLPQWCPQHSMGGQINYSAQPMPLHMWLQPAPYGMGQTALLETSESNMEKKSVDSGSPRSQSCDSPTPLSGSPNSKGSPQIDNTDRKVMTYGEESLIGKPVLKMDQMFGSTAMTGLRSHLGVLPPVASPLMMIPCYQYSPAMSPPWCHWPANPPHMSRFPPVPVNPHYCSTPSASLSGSQPIHPQSTALENAFHWRLQHKLHTPPICPTHQMLQSKKVFPFAGDGYKSKPYSSNLKSDTQNTKGDEFSHSNAWSGFQPHSSAASTQSFSCKSPCKLPNSFLGEPIKHLKRLAQLPDDKCALLPISPPLTPHTSVSTLLPMSQSQLASIN